MTGANVPEAPEAAGRPEGRRRDLSPVQAAALAALPVAALAAMALPYREHPALLRSMLGAAGSLAVWAMVLFGTGGVRGRRFALEAATRPARWVSLAAPGVILGWWGWHVPGVVAFLPLIAAQVLFAVGFGILLQWSRGPVSRVAPEPLAAVLVVNLFLWFTPEAFHYQFALVAVGLTAVAFLRWTRQGQKVAIFGAAAFPLAVTSALLVATGASDATLGAFIAGSQQGLPLAHLVIFLACVPGFLVVGGAGMTLAAVATTYGISLAYLGATGTYLFYDAHVPVPVFLAMHVLLPEPATAPRSVAGRLMVGVLYAAGTAGLYALLLTAGAPTFHDKLLLLPLLGLMARRLDGWAETSAEAGPLPAGHRAGSGPGRREAALTAVWAVVFATMTLTRGVGDRHPGQYLPFWQDACEDGSARACAHRERLTLRYCNEGSGWACNEWGILQAEKGAFPGRAFHEACDLGFRPACANTVRDRYDPATLNRGPPATEDLPIVLRGSKPRLEEHDPERLLALACRQGWQWACE